MPAALHVLMVAAENDALPGGKVGGVGDVVRDVPRALAALPEFDGTVTVLTPSYGFLHQGGQPAGRVHGFRFGEAEHSAELFEVPGKQPCPRVRQLVLHHPGFESVDPATGRRRIYVDDPSDQPFASDATKFALLCSAVAEGLKSEVFGPVNRLHLHDWHVALVLLLRACDPRYASLRSLRTAFTIHNLALQGIRPARNDDSSLEAWYPWLDADPDLAGDPEYEGCVNPMAVGIRLADAVHVVSPGYREEVCQPSRPARNDPQCVFFGGEGLDADLRQARDQGRLFGILNGCEYPEHPRDPAPPTDTAWRTLLETLRREVAGWFQRRQVFRHWLTLRRLDDWLATRRPRPAVLLTSVTRVVDQKVRLMRIPESDHPLDRILTELPADAVYILAGSGDAGYESFLEGAARRHPNLLFVNGYSQAGADALYATGDLFLMPSAFEPCGISQMLAMRDGQPCVVHSIGGLKDTVRHLETGFAFSGTTQEELGDAFVRTTLDAAALCANDRTGFESIRRAAAQARFLWSDSVREYLRVLY